MTFLDTFAHWGVGDWAIFALSAAIFLFGAFELAFADRLNAREEARRAAAGEDAPRQDHRTTGFVALIVGALGLAFRFF